MQQNDEIVVDNDNLLVVCDDSKETIVATQNATDPNVHEIFANDSDSISITKNDSIDENNVCYSPSWSFHGGGGVSGENDDRNARDFECDLTQSQLPVSLKFNRNTMSIFVKKTPNKLDEQQPKRQAITQQNNDFNEDSEDIICSPNFDSSEPTKVNDHFKRFRAQPNPDENYTKIYDDDEDDDDEAKERRNDRVIELLQYKDPLRSAVVLRSPRGNQPRSYTTDALYSALMDVKSGESIYR